MTFNHTTALSRRAMLGAGAALAAASLATIAPAQTPTSNAKPITRHRGALEVSPIGLGCMAMAPGFYNPPPPPADMVGLIRDAHEMGVTFFDTAEVYSRFAPEDRRAAVPFFASDALPVNMGVVALARDWAQRKDATPVQIALA